MQDDAKTSPSADTKADDTNASRKEPRDRWRGEAPKPVEPRNPPKQQEGPRATFAALKPPSLNLPKGGGALKSIGETYRVSPVTGTASAEIPLPITPAPRGPSPQLSLSYDSGQGNGLFGLGWSVGVPQITRKTDKRLPEYLDSQESDVFVFAGEDLVPALRLELGSWVPDVDPSIVEGEAPNQKTYRVVRYRSRIEGAHSKIERWTDQDTRVSHWRVTTRDNTRFRYGDTPETRIADPGGAQRVFTWLLRETRDDRGHVVTYVYKQENDIGVSYSMTSEAHRRVPAAPPAPPGYRLHPNRYLERVRYGNTTPDDPGSYKLELVFDFGEYDIQAPQPDDTGLWTVRQDPFSSYRSGFELRTYRLCKRVLMFQHFDEIHARRRLVRSLELTYASVSDLQKAAQIVEAKVKGHTWNDAANPPSYDTAELPRVVFTYSQAAFTKKIQQLSRDDARDFNPVGLNKAAQLVDLDGEGVPGILTDRGRAVTFKNNLGPSEPGPQGRAQFASARTLTSVPNLPRQGAGAAQLQDVAGSGSLALLRLDPRASGYHERIVPTQPGSSASTDGWGPFRTFTNNPNVDWSDPNLRMVDLNGDGFDDILITRGDHIVWIPSLGRDGYGSAKRVDLPRDPRQGPAVIFADRRASVFLADMSGDGLTDIVQVLHSRVAYWPNLGHGRFGAQVVMDNCPVIEREDRFHANRVRLADLDGTGTADLLYFDKDGMHVWPNLSGNAFGDKKTNECVPVPSALPTLAITDLLGNGMSTLAWCPTHDMPQVPLRHTSPYGTEKPYLLKSIDNGMGLTVAFQYAPSTQFYLADKKAQKPWATKLPFPVQVVTKVEAYDAVSKTRFASTYSYHHGHYDSVEREFRGFGRVDQYDAETFDDDAGKGSFPGAAIENGELAQPPILTRTWFHLGTWRDHDTRNGTKLEAAYATEYWTGDGNAHKQLYCDVAPGLPDEQPLSDVPLPIDEIPDAHRALKGTMIRQEVYGHERVSGAWLLDTIPFTVTESAYRAVRRQPSCAAATKELPKQPPVFQSLALETRTHTYDRVDNDPRVHQWVALEHDARTCDVTRSLAVAYARRGAAVATEQGSVYALLTETDIAHALTDGYRLSIPTETRAFELHGIPDQTTTPIARDVLVIDLDVDHVPPVPRIAYHQSATGGYELRLVEHIRVQYFKSNALPTPPTLPTAPTHLHDFGAVDPLALVYQTYQLDVTTAHLSDAVFQGKITTTLLLAGKYVDLHADGRWWIPSGFSYLDVAHFYLPTDFRDPFNNNTHVQYDAPHYYFASQVTDAKNNTVIAAHDYRVFAPWLITDPNGNRTQAKFDQLGRVTAVAVMGKSTESLGDDVGSYPTEAFEYHTDQWLQSPPKPNYAKRIARETHGSGATAFQISYVYTDGSGRVALTKAQAEPDPNPPNDPRWVGSGRTVVNNKGNPVKQYEPYFATTHDYETEFEIRTVGVTPLITYDAVGRVIKFQNPDQTFRTTEHSPWLETAYDENDNAVGGPHYDTPARTHFDPLGRPFLVQAQIGFTENPPPEPPTRNFYDTRTTLDIENQPLAVKDPLGRTCQTHVFSMSGRLLVESNIDKGARIMLQDVTGALMRRWDARLQEFRFEYDELRRPIKLWLSVNGASEVLLERRYYGEAAATPATSNLRGQLILLFDQAGKTELGPFDFKGNLLESRRTLAQNYTSAVDWDVTGVELDSVDDPAAAETAATALLETETWPETREYDALNRVITLTTPDGSVYEPTFNEAGLLETVEVTVRGTGGATSFVSNIDYNAKGQRTLIEYANGTKTEYTYHDLTFRLTDLVTTRIGDSKKLQDLTYSYDPVGNIIAIADDAHQEVFFDDNLVSADQVFGYDALYRLVSATGREHASLGITIIGTDGAPLRNLPDANADDALRSYTETYGYDQVGNITSLGHVATGSTSGSWTRAYTYLTGTNRLESTTGTGVGAYTPDAHGNMITLPGVGALDYSPFDQMSHADLQGGGDAYYTYDASGQRVRKVVDTGANLIKERIYLGGYEIYRERILTPTPAVQLERHTLHVNDGARRIAMVETLVTEGGDPVSSPEDLVRVQYTNHLGTAVLECDQNGNVISYEEMHPYGSSAYRSAPSASEVSARRYRYTGKERDEETGLDYFGARYYAPWLGRWTSADPLGLQAGLNLYQYCRGSPAVMVDPNGMDSQRALPPPQLTGEDPVTYLGEGAGTISGPAPPADPPAASAAPPHIEVDELEIDPSGNYIYPDVEHDPAPPPGMASAGAGGADSGTRTFENSTSEDFIPGLTGPAIAAMLVPLAILGGVAAIGAAGAGAAGGGGALGLGSGGGLLTGSGIPWAVIRGGASTGLFWLGNNGPRIVDTAQQLGGGPSALPLPAAGPAGPLGQAADDVGAAGKGVLGKLGQLFTTGGSAGGGRAITAADLGLRGAKLEKLKGSVIDSGTTRILTVDDIAGIIPPADLRGALPRILEAARSNGIEVLQIDARLANPALARFVAREVEKHGGIAATESGRETFTFMLRGKR